MDTSKRKFQFGEAVVTGVILLVLVQTFLEDWAVVFGWAWNARRILVYTGLAFDVFFTIEFIVRLYLARTKGSVSSYLFWEHGWIDFLASIPLLVLSSGPRFISVLSGAAFLGGTLSIIGILKIIKIIRVARVLRLFRMLKISARMRTVHSRMAQRHLTRIATTVLCIIILTSMLSSFLSDSPASRNLTRVFEDSVNSVVNRIAQADPETPEGMRSIEENAANDPNVLLVRRNNRVLYSRYPQPERAAMYSPSDYAYIETDGVEVYVDLSDFHADGAWANLLTFFTSLLSLLGILFLYGPHFTRTVVDPVQAMSRGLNEDDYHLAVFVPPQYSGDEVFALARDYNKRYLAEKGL